MRGSLSLVLWVALVGPLVAQQLEVTNGLELWLKADGGFASEAPSKYAISSWYDESPNHYHLDQPDPAQRPIYKPVASNGHPAIHFDGTKQSLSLPAGGNGVGVSDLGGDTTVFFVAEFDDFDAYRTVLTQSKKNLAAPTDWYTVKGTGIAKLHRATQDGKVWTVVSRQAIPKQQFVLVAWTQNGPKLSVSLSGVAEGDSTNSAYQPSRANERLIVGARDDGGSQMKGDVQEILIYRRALTSVERVQVVSYLSNKYFGGKLAAVASLPADASPTKAIASYAPASAQTSKSGADASVVPVETPHGSFLMQAAPVTQGMFKDVLHRGKVFFDPENVNQSVTSVAWNEATEYSNLLSARDGLDPVYATGGLADLTKNGWRLPTVAEWDYAESKSKDLGLIAMNGAVWQWCSTRDPLSAGWAVRGGEGRAIPGQSRSKPQIIDLEATGFRVVRSLPGYTPMVETNAGVSGPDLRGKSLRWASVLPSSGQVPLGAFRAGTGNAGTPLYLARTQVGGATIVGEYNPAEKTFLAAVGSQLVAVTKEKVEVFTGMGSWVKRDGKLPDNALDLSPAGGTSPIYAVMVPGEAVVDLGSCGEDGIVHLVKTTTKSAGQFRLGGWILTDIPPAPVLFQWIVTG